MHMKHKLPLITARLALCSLLVLVGCERNIDLANLDTHVATSMGIALPIGQMSATLGDFIQTNTLDNVYIREDGVYYFHDTTDITTLSFHALNLRRFDVRYHTQFALYTILHTLTQGQDRIVGDGTTSLTLDCPLQVDIPNVNQDIEQERIDSLIMDSLVLSLAISPIDLDLRAQEITRLSLTLGNEFRCDEGSKIDCPSATLTDSVRVVLHHVCLRLMNDPSDRSKGNKNTFALALHLQLTPQAGHVIEVQTTSALSIDLAMQVHGFQAIWGFFVPSNDMNLNEVIALDSLIGKEVAQQLKTLQLRLAEPVLSLRFTHHVAAPLLVKMKHLYAYHSAIHQRTYATWNNQPTVDMPLQPMLSPVSDLQDSVTSSLRFSNLENEGHIDRLFDYFPDSIGYCFEIGLDPAQRESFPQYRLVNNTSVHADAVVSVPFVFKEQTALRYEFTLDSINISAYSLDSLLPKQSIDSVRQADLRLFLTISNGIPFAIQAKMQFLDDRGQIVNLHPLAGDSLRIAAPEDIQNHKVITPKETDIIIHLTRDEWRTFSQVKKIRLEAFLGDNPATVQLDTRACLALRLGLSAKADVVYDFNNIF